MCKVKKRPGNDFCLMLLQQVYFIPKVTEKAYLSVHACVADRLAFVGAEAYSS